MLFGTILPNADIGTDPEAIRDYARAVAELDTAIRMKHALTAVRSV